MSSSAEPTLDRDQPCRRCRYNLRTLRADGVCPECGTAVADTLKRYAPPSPLKDSRRRRRVVALGCFGIAVGLAVFVLVWWVVECLWRYSLEFPTGFWPVDPPWLYGPPAVLIAVALVLTCLPQQRTNGRPAFLVGRLPVLLVAPVAPLAAIVWEYGYARAPFYEFASYRRAAQWVTDVTPLVLVPALLTLASTARAWGFRTFPGPLRFFAMLWLIAGFRVAQGAMWTPGIGELLPTRLNDALGDRTPAFQMIWLVALADTIALLISLGVRLWSTTAIEAPESRP